MYSKTSLDETDKMEVPVEGNDGLVKPVGYAMLIDKMRPNYWYYEEGKSGSKHRQEEQEELYFVLEGRIRMELELDGETDEVTMEEGDFVTVPPEPWRQLFAEEESEMLVVGSPNNQGDHVLPDE